MKDIVVGREKLLARLRENRTLHRVAYAEAERLYRARAVEWLQEQLGVVSTGGPVELYFKLLAPENNTESYDTAIGMLEWAVDDTVVLGRHDYERYVEDKWEWKDRFNATARSYRH